MVIKRQRQYFGLLMTVLQGAFYLNHVVPCGFCVLVFDFLISFKYFLAVLLFCVTSNTVVERERERGGERSLLYAV